MQTNRLTAALDERAFGDKIIAMYTTSKINQDFLLSLMEFREIVDATTLASISKDALHAWLHDMDEVRVE